MINTLIPPRVPTTVISTVQAQNNVTRVTPEIIYFLFGEPLSMQSICLILSAGRIFREHRLMT
jgi:hypothetical protein